MPAEPITKTCPICWETFTATGRQAGQRIYCSTRCKRAALERRARDGLVPSRRTVTIQPSTAPTTNTEPALPQPAAHRDCPHCGAPIIIVALLTTPEAARPQQPIAAPDGVIPLRR